MSGYTLCLPFLISANREIAVLESKIDWGVDEKVEL